MLITMQPKKLINTIFFDRDGVINDIVVRQGKTSSPHSFAEFKVRDDFCRFHEAVSMLPVRRFVVTNQPDVSRGLLPLSELEAMTEELQRRFAFDEVVCCTHDNHHDCSCRKPKSGMITSLLQKYQLEPGNCVIIGDSHKDVIAGQGAGILTVYLRHDYNAQLGCQPEFIVDNLREVLNIISFAG